ncbi:MAG TPA: response regulator, partial [Methylomirabilota bacterium]|nr:response regulator [Methylomirabilota bacterium]
DRQARSTLVCVIDDDPSLLRALQRLLVAGGFTVAVFPSAEAFLGSERANTVDCLVLDVHLGGMSGFELYDRLVAAGTRIPVVFITAHDDGPTRERANRAGAVAYMRKPFDDESLIGAIHKALGRA